MQRKAGHRLSHGVRKVKLAGGPVLFESFLQQSTLGSPAASLKAAAIKRHDVNKKRNVDKENLMPLTDNNAPRNVQRKSGNSYQIETQEEELKKLPDFDSIEKDSLLVESASYLKHCSDLQDSRACSSNDSNVPQRQFVFNTENVVARNCEMEFRNALESTPNPSARHIRHSTIVEEQMVSPISDANNSSAFEGFVSTDFGSNHLPFINRNCEPVASPSVIYLSNPSLRLSASRLVSTCDVENTRDKSSSTRDCSRISPSGYVGLKSTETKNQMTSHLPAFSCREDSVIAESILNENVSRELHLRSRTVYYEPFPRSSSQSSRPISPQNLQKGALAATIDVLLPCSADVEMVEDSFRNLSLVDDGAPIKDTNCEIELPIGVNDSSDQFEEENYKMHSPGDDLDASVVINIDDTAMETSMDKVSLVLTSRRSCDLQATEIVQNSRLETAGKVPNSNQKSKQYTPQLKMLSRRVLHEGSLSGDLIMQNFSPARLPLSPSRSIYKLCNQPHGEPMMFSKCIPQSLMKSIVKIGEGVYGEVFRATTNDNTVVYKIIPIEGDFTVNDEPQKTFAEILPEVVIAKEMSRLRHGKFNRTPNFVEVLNVSCVRDSYPLSLLAAWNRYDEKNRSDNDNPVIFTENQLFIVFQFADGGSDLERATLCKSKEAESIIQQLALALAIAESELKFEHRDLHIGNILLKSTELEYLDYVLDKTSRRVKSQGIQVFIIDFTLSRLQKENMVLFTDLANDEGLFCGQGDYQFDIYRNTRDINGNVWDEYTPRSNVLWLHYILDKLISFKKYNGKKLTLRQSSKLRSLHERLLQYADATDLVENDDFFQTIL